MQRNRIFALATQHIAKRWKRNQSYLHAALGRLMEPAIGVFAADTTVGVTLEALRTLAKSAVINYAHIVDADEKLLGVNSVRERLFADIVKTLAVMLTALFTPSLQSPMPDATRVSLNRRRPIYPVCDDSGSRLGLVRAQIVFASETFEITTPAGRMAGVDREERILTPRMRSLKFGHPWLQLIESGDDKALLFEEGVLGA